MANLLVSLVAVVGFAWFVIVVHEYGHLVVGRLSGVPGDDIRVNLAGKPPHVALRKGPTWLSPDDAGYAKTFQAHCPRTLCAWTFVAGGFVMESFVSLTGIITLASLGAGSTANLWAWTTLMIFISYVTFDILMTARTRTAYGDVSALWQIHPPGTLALAVAITLVKILSIVAL